MDIKCEHNWNVECRYENKKLFGVGSFPIMHKIQKCSKCGIEEKYTRTRR